MKVFQKGICAAALFLSITSCGLVNEDEVVVPAYVYIPSYTFVTDSSNVQGANSEAFNDMWISNAGEGLGALGLPSLLPVQKSGPTEIRVEAGISNTGQDNSRLAYPFVAAHIEVRDLKPGVIDTIIPVFKYLNGTGFKFIEDFDRITRAFEVNPSYKSDGDTIMAVTDINSWRSGNACGKIEFPDSQEFIQIVTKELYELDGSGAPAFVEIDYKSNLTLDIGYYYLDPLTGMSANNSIIYTYAESKWKKLYVDLTGEVTSRRVGTKYIIYIGVFNPDHITPEVYIDNVKLVYFK